MRIHVSSQTCTCAMMRCLLQAGKALDLPVYFGDAGSSAVLHSLGAQHAACAVITLDTPGARPSDLLPCHRHHAQTVPTCSKTPIGAYQKGSKAQHWDAQFN